MIYHDYSPEQLERAAEQLLLQFNPDFLKQPKKYDVYAVIENCLGVEYDWKYIRPDQKILGLTAFNEGFIYVSPKPYFEKGIEPEEIYLSKGCILIDSTLPESGNIGRERFTVMHEVMHQVLHKKEFRRMQPDYVHCSTGKALFGGKKRIVTALDLIEYQANAGAAAFLMPRKIVPLVFRDLTAGFARTYPIADDFRAEQAVSEMAKLFGVSKQAMRYRLYHLTAGSSVGISSFLELINSDTIIQGVRHYTWIPLSKTCC